MIGSHPSEVVRTVSALLCPVILTFGAYVIAHGHYGPGGGFAGGVILAVGVILVRLTTDAEATYRRFPEWAGPVTMAFGLLVFVVVGLVPVLAGGQFLEYAATPVEGMTASRLRYTGILVVEVGIGLAVFGTMLSIFDVLVRQER